MRKKAYKGQQELMMKGSRSANIGTWTVAGRGWDVQMLSKWAIQKNEDD